MTCAEALSGYWLRSLGYGERLLPRGEISFCEQVVLIGSGLIWNVYFAFLAICFGFVLATLVALGKASRSPLFFLPARAFVYAFRGTPLFIQFFFAYAVFLTLPSVYEMLAPSFPPERDGGPISVWGIEITRRTFYLTQAWLGALVVLILNTTAYSAEIFYGALRSVPRGDLEAAAAVGMTGRRRFLRIVWPTMLRLAWPAYTNEAIFLFHATTLVYFSGFPAWAQQGDALYYANYFAQQTYNPFVAYPVAAAYFALVTLGLIFVFGRIGRRLNRHLAPADRARFRFRPQYIR